MMRYLFGYFPDINLVDRAKIKIGFGNILKPLVSLNKMINFHFWIFN